MKTTLSLFLVIVVIIFTGCKNDSSVGASIIPEEDKVQLTVDNSQKVIVYSVNDIPTYTRNNHVDSILIRSSVVGSHIDPVFGKTIAGLYFELFSEVENSDLGTSTSKLDSIIFELRVNSFYGDIDAVNHFELYAMNESFSADNNFSDDFIAIDGTPLDVYDFTLNANTMPSVDDKSKEMSSGVLRFKLDLADLLTDDSIRTFNHDWFNELNFYLVGSGVDYGGGLFQVILEESRLTMFGRDTSIVFTNEEGESSITDRIERSFVASNESNSLNIFRHNNIGSDLEAAINNPDTINGEALVYIQSMDAYRVKVDLREIKNLENLLISQAELSFEVGEENENYPLPEVLGLHLIDEDGLEIAFSDWNAIVYGSESSTYNGNYFGGELIDNKYTFNIARHVQEVIDGKEDRTAFYLRINYGHSFPSRLVLKGNNNTNSGVELKLKYTEIN